MLGLDPVVESMAARHGSRVELTAARERWLLRVARSSRDPKARHAAVSELCESHAGLVLMVAGEYRRAGVEPPELICAGFAGLHEAIEHFQPTAHGPRLAGHAMGRIRWHVRHYKAGDIRRAPLPPALAHRQVMRLWPRLLAGARRDCVREGAPQSQSDLLIRVARRVGLPVAEMARVLARAAQDTPSIADEASLGPRAERNGGSVVSRLDHVRARRRLTVLADTMLGFRERVVFLARCLSNADTATQVDKLARRLGVSPDRIVAIEASARRKIATAAWVEGLADIGIVSGPPHTAPHRTAAFARGVATGPSPGRKKA